MDEKVAIYVMLVNTKERKRFKKVGLLNLTDDISYYYP